MIKTFTLEARKKSAYKNKINQMEQYNIKINKILKKLTTEKNQQANNGFFEKILKN